MRTQFLFILGVRKSKYTTKVCVLCPKRDHKIHNTTRIRRQGDVNAKPNETWI